MTICSTPGFEKFPFHKDLLKAILEIGYEKPTPIQDAVISDILNGKDVTAKAQTGSGKTAAFCLPALQLMLLSDSAKMLILTPTRELALQICTEIEKFCKYLNIEPNAVYGGDSITKQVRKLKRDNRIIVSTPGRLLDLFRSKHLKDFEPSIVVLDEGDEMLNMGFFEDIQSIFSYLPQKRQTLLFSATLSSRIQKISQMFLKNPVLFDHSNKTADHKDIKQIYYTFQNRNRKVALLKALQFNMPTKAIVFCNTKKEVSEIASVLTNSGFSTLSLQGDMSQKDRQASIGNFRKSTNIILVATDVAARGLDVADISHVINFDLPYSADCFTHRVGRTGRSGNKGTAITLISQNQKHLLRKVIFKKASEITFSELPTKDDLKLTLEKRLNEQITQSSVHQDAEKILSSLLKNCKLEEVSLHFISKYLESTLFQIDELVGALDNSKPREERFKSREGRFRSKDSRGRSKMSFSNRRPKRK